MGQKRMKTQKMNKKKIDEENGNEKPEEGFITRAFSASSNAVTSVQKTSHNISEKLGTNGKSSSDCKQHCREQFDTFSGIICFAGDTQVQVVTEEEEGRVFPRAMELLRVGDRIVVGGSSGSSSSSSKTCHVVEPVIAWLHRDLFQEAPFVEVSGGARMTPNHLVFSENPGNKFVQAQDLVGDQDWTWGRGVYAPLTPSGTLIAGGILCSCYAVTHQADFSLFYALAGEHNLLHGLTLPLRMLRGREGYRKEEKRGEIMDPLLAHFWNPRAESLGLVV